MAFEDDDADGATPPTVGRSGSDSSVGWGKPPPSDARSIGGGAPTFGDDVERGRYAVLERIGRGGMGEVHLAKDGRVGRSVALKVLLDEGVNDAALRGRFVREARIQGQLEHPGIVPVYDIEHDANGRPFFAMKRVTGETLEAIVRKLAKGDPEAVAAYTMRRLLAAFQQICLTVHYAHTQGVIHRDIKLSNLMLGDFGEVYVLDWGIAKVRDVDEPGLGTASGSLPHVDATRRDHVLGTPGYIPPEQLSDSANVDARADVYALGAVLFALLTRKRLHGRGTAAEVIESPRRGADARASVVAPELEIPPELDTICVRATAQRPEDRYATARELHDAVERVLEGDRDVRLRAELAEQHLVEARRALGEGTAAPAGTAESRRRALREAGRALALQPDNVEAGELLASMMLTPPSEVPDELVRASLELELAEQLRLGRVGIFVVLGIVALLSLLVWVGVRSWSAVAWILGPLLVTVAVTVYGPRVRVERGRYYALASGIPLAIAIGASSTIVGPLWLPAIFATTFAAIFVVTHSLGRWRFVSVALAVLSILVPLGLERAGVLPEHYVVNGEHVIVLGEAVDYPAHSVPALTLACVANVLLVSFALWQFSKGDMNTRRELQLMAWHLRQMAPLRDSTRPPPRASVRPEAEPDPPHEDSSTTLRARSPWSRPRE